MTSAGQGHEVNLDIFNEPSETGVKRLLNLSNLNVSDLTLEHMKHFFGLGTKDEPGGIVGLELFKTIGLLRSLAVVQTRRRNGLGSKLVAHAEEYARSHSIKSLYLLTNTAGAFFMHRGYQRIKRNDAPREIQETREFSEICPVSSILMVKHL